MNSKLPRTAFLLGLSGLLPQALAIADTLKPGLVAIGPTSGALYAALIFSFVGGLWWGIAAARPEAPHWLYAVAVMPSLIAFGPLLLWSMNSDPPVVALVIIGSGLLLSPLVDWQLKRLRLVPQGWLTMRIILSVGLGAMTLALAMRA